ncbi:low affinity iron permease family protein [Pseudomonas aeruginosa]
MSLSRFAQRLSNWAGRPPTFVVALGLILLWAISGPLFDFNDTWQLVINYLDHHCHLPSWSSLIQNTQNRATDALHIKIDELLRSTRRALTMLLGLDDLDADTLGTASALPAHGRAGRRDAGKRRCRGRAPVRMRRGATARRLNRRAVMAHGRRTTLQVILAFFRRTGRSPPVRRPDAGGGG